MSPRRADERLLAATLHANLGVAGGHRVAAQLASVGPAHFQAVHLYETHLPVQDTEASSAFYQDIVGLEVAYRDPTRDVVFLWVGEGRRSMLGLWGPDTAYGREPSKRHLAFAVTLAELLAAGPRLQARGVATSNFQGQETAEPSVLGWMPSAQLYFRDPDGHALEYLALLDDAPDAAFIGALSTWQHKA